MVKLHMDISAVPDRGAIANYVRQLCTMTRLTREL